MKYVIMLGLVTLLLIHCDDSSTEPEAVGQLFINEFLASNDSSSSDEFGDFDDWVELYNETNATIDIGGMYISDDPLDPNPWQIPLSLSQLTSIPAGGFLVLWCDEEPEQGPLHVDIKLSANGESIVLWEADKTTVVDSLSFRAQISDISWGRSVDGGDYWQSFSDPTPGTTNTP